MFMVLFSLGVFGPRTCGLTLEQISDKHWLPFWTFREWHPCGAWYGSWKEHNRRTRLIWNRDQIPGHGPHRYIFQILAPSRRTAFSSAPKIKVFLDGISGTVIGRGMLMGTYELR